MRWSTKGETERERSLNKSEGNRKVESTRLKKKAKQIHKKLEMAGLCNTVSVKKVLRKIHLHIQSRGK